VARQDSSHADDAVPLKPEDLRLMLPVPHSAEACAGAAAGFVMRKIAYRAGTYAPGIQEFLFHDLSTVSAGRSLASVSDWFGMFGSQLQAMGYRIQARRVMGEKTEAILGWVKEGKGYRGAVLETNYARMHPAEAADITHAVGVTMDREQPNGPEDLVMIDPWPGTMNGARDRGPIPTQLELAHREKKYSALILYWSGWS
jgi:hypothetical protein